MTNPKLYPVVVDDFVPFCIFTVAKTKAQAKKNVEEKYEWLNECANIEYLPPFSLNEGRIFAVDVEMSLIEDSKELFLWLCPDDEGFYADGFRTNPTDLVVVEVDNDKDTSEESGEDKDDDKSESKSEDSDDSKYEWV